MNEIFGPEGLIAQAHPEYEHRPGQIEMARAVMRAFEGPKHLIVEAGTGTGKTLAYLVPAGAGALGGRGRGLISPPNQKLFAKVMGQGTPFFLPRLPARVQDACQKGRQNDILPLL